jgi:hypothetical protein
MKIDVRKIVVVVEDVRHDGGPVLTVPLKRGYVACVLKNPFAGRYEPEIVGMMDTLKPLAGC